MVSIVYERLHSTFTTLWCSTSLNVKFDLKLYQKLPKTWLRLHNFTDLQQAVLKFNDDTNFLVQNTADDVQNNALCQKITSGQKL